MKYKYIILLAVALLSAGQAMAQRYNKKVRIDTAQVVKDYIDSLQVLRHRLDSLQQLNSELRR